MEWRGRGKSQYGLLSKQIFYIQLVATFIYIAAKLIEVFQGQTGDKRLIMLKDSSGIEMNFSNWSAKCQGMYFWQICICLRFDQRSQIVETIYVKYNN